MNTPTAPATAAAPRLNYRQTSPKVVTGMLALQQVVNESELEHSLLELVKLRASQINGCAFCVDMHARDAKRHGETDARLHLLAVWEEAPVFSARERAALRWTETLTRLADHGMPDSIYESVREHFDEQEIVNLTAAIVAINGWNRFSVGFKIPPGTPL